MKNTLLYYYNVEIEEYTTLNDDIISFYIDYNKFYFIKIKRVKRDIEEIYEFINKHINKYHFIIKNKYGNIFTEENKSSYILIKINGPENIEIELNEIIKEQIPVGSNELEDLKRNNWSNLWSEKVDYLEYQISELGKNHPIILNSFSYYVGLAENAIEYFNLINGNSSRLVLSQKRLIYPNVSLNNYNPINLVVDYRVRDIGEYIKNKFFNNGNALDDIKWLAEKNILSSDEYNLLYARLLYPSYYFDDITRIIENKKNEDTLLKFINQVDSYEKFLKSTFDIFSTKCSMNKIEWIIKKES